MNRPVHILYLEDSPRDVELVRAKLQQCAVPHDLRVVSDRAEYEAALAETRFDLILSDYQLPGYDGMGALAYARTTQPGVPFILISGTLGEEQAVDCVLRGATDYVLKQRLSRLGPAVQRALTEAAERGKRRQAEELLRKSDERYRSVISALAEGVILLSRDGGVVTWNHSAERILGLSADQLQGRKALDPGWRTIHEDGSPFPVDAHPGAEVLRTGNPQSNVIMGIQKSAGVFTWLTVHAVPVFEPGDLAPSAVVLSFADITDRKRAEMALRDSAAEFRAMFETASIGMAQTDPTTGQWVRVNQKMCAITGYSADELLRKRITELTHPADQQQDWEAFQRVVRGEAADYRIEKRYLRKDGAIAWVNVNMTVIRDAAGRVTRTMATIEDITERKQTEESHLRLATAVDQSAETIVITDADASILYVNPAFEKITGYSRADVLGKNPRVLKSGKQDAAFYRRMWDTLGRGEVWQGHMINKRKDGSFFEEEATISPVRNAEGKVVHYVAAKRDVTHEAQLENKLRQAQKMEAVGRLAGGIAHDFNNLLMGIMGYAELCLDHVAPDHPNRERLNEIINAARKSSDITRQLLTFARKQITSPKIVDLNDAVSGMLKLLKQLIGEDIRLVWLPDSTVRTIRIDPAQVDQLLANLCLNARDAIAGIGTITLETHHATLDATTCALHPEASPGAYVQLTVRDTGCGMDAETLEHIFEPFFTTKSLGHGTGLGLATVHGIVNQNKGFIEVASEPGKGTTFTLYLPQVAAAPGERSASAATQAPKGQGETVLLVEDEKSLRVTCSQFLLFLGYKVLLADSPDAALELAERHPGSIDLLLTDVVMPGMYGTALATRLGALRPGLKVLLMSGYAADAMAQRGIQDHALPFIAKPFSRTELAYKVREVLEAKASSRPPPDATRKTGP